MIAITLLPVSLLFIFVNLLPIGWAVTAGFFRISTFSPVWEWAGFSNYVAVLQADDFWMSLWRSTLFAAGSVILQLVVGTGIALLINEKMRFATLIRAIIITPYLIPTAIVGFMALFMGNSQYGVVNLVLLELGLIAETIPWFGSLDFAMLAVILTSSWKFTIFVTIMVLARLQSIEQGYYEAATVMGATTFQKFRDITLPNIKGVIFIVLLLRGIWMFNKFDIIWVLTRGGPLGKTTTSAIYAYQTAFVTYNLGRAAAISTLLFCILAVGAIIYFKVLEPSKEVRTS